MRPERWQQLDRLFQSALEHKPEERAVFLDEACVGDESLRKEVGALLAEEAGSFIESPAFGVEAWAIADEQKVLAAGQMIGHYKIVSQLGTGGMAEVYLAEDTTLGRRVALKLLPADFTSDIDRVARFQQEARAASALNHPNIITIHEIAQIDDRHLIATEFVEGETLRQRINAARSRTSGYGDGKSGMTLQLDEVLNIGIQIADALAAAHEAGIVHRDIKPENIMVRWRDGYIKVLDFGLAKLTQSVGVAVDKEAPTKAQVKTSPGLLMGTVTYMSPEQTRGEKVDVRTDIWSLGGVLYELVAGCAPFERPTPSEVIALILERDPPPLTQYVRDVPSELEWIISKALTKDKDQRYQTAKDLLIDLRRLLQRLEIDEEIERSASPESGHAKAPGASHQATMRPGSRADYVIDKITHHRRVALIASGTLVLAIAAVIYFSYLPTKVKAIDSIAVLPFLNVSSDPNTEYLSDGIPEALINSMTELRQLRVIARATAFRYKGKDVDPQAVGRELGVQAVLMGRMRQMGDTLNIQVDLVDAATGAQIWGQEYERKASDVLSVKQSIARQVTEKLRLRLSGEQQQGLTKRDTTNTEAYQFFLRGRYFSNARTADGLKKAIVEFQHAIDLDPNYALAYVGISDSYLLLEQYGGTPANETLPKARAAVERALEIDDSLAEAHTSLGMIESRSWNFDESEEEYRRAIALNPNYATAHHWYSLNLRDVRGRFDEALAEIKIAQRLDPLSPGIGAAAAGTLAVKGERDAAFQEAKKVIELDPKLPIGHWTLGVLYRWFGRYEEAIAEGENAVELSRRASLYLSELGVCYAAAGNRARALELLKEVEEKYTRREATGLYVAYVYAALGDKDQAFAWLERDFQAHSGRLPQIAHNPLWENLRDDPRFQDLLRRMKLLQ